MILVDTSVWVDHLREGSRRLVTLLEEDQVLAHPFVVGELALGHLKRRAEILELLADLPQVKAATHEDALGFVEQHALAGTGIGWVDIHLLTSASLNGVPFWTVDRRLAAAAARLGLAGHDFPF